MKRGKVILITLAFAFLLLSPALSAQTDIAAGAGDFVFNDQAGEKSRAVKVYYYAPKKLNADTKIVFVLHGNSRNGRLYRDEWMGHAQKYNFLVLCPEFSEKDYPGSSGYVFGNMYDSRGRPIEKNKWGFSVIEHLFDYVKKSKKMSNESYCIFGHSSGAQFVQRMILFLPEARTSLAIAANAGVYTVPDFNTPFCLGIKDTTVTDQSLKKSFSKDMIIMLGQKDIIPREESEQERKQGRHRLEKGFNFIRTSRQCAKLMQTRFNWLMKTVPAAGHNSPRLSVVASRLFAKSAKQRAERPAQPMKTDSDEGD